MSLQTVQSGISAIQNALVLLMKFICVLTGSVMAVLVFVGVIYRYFLGASLAYATALPTFLFPYLIMSGAVIAAARREHLSVDYALLRTPKVVQRWMPFTTKLLVAVAFVWVALIAVRVLSTLATSITPLLGWPASWAFYSLPAGFVLLGFYAATEAVSDLIGNVNVNLSQDSEED